MALLRSYNPTMINCTILWLLAGGIRSVSARMRPARLQGRASVPLRASNNFPLMEQQNIQDQRLL
jgi:hypothetical protein